MSETTIAQDCLVHSDAYVADLEPDPSRAGEPVTSSRTFGTLGEVDVGVWQIEPGTASDVETDEIFVVLSGRGTVEFDDDSGLDLAPGVVVHLRAGDHTVWRIEEPVRKVYISR